jgi:predicted ATPase
MLEPVRQYARERLEASEVGDAVRGRHAEYYLALAEEVEPEPRGPDQLAELQRLVTEHANLRAALSWALYWQDIGPEDRAGLGLRLAAALWKFWSSHGNSIEGRRWLERGLSTGGTGPQVRARALNGLGRMVFVQGDGRAVA